MTLIPFVPSSNTTPPFQTSFVLDNLTYIATVTWNISGQRWYIALTDQSNNLIVMQPLIGSPLNSDIILFPNTFKSSTVLYREDTGNFEVSP